MNANAVLSIPYDSKSVVWVDGDGFRLGGIHYRLADVDAPELNQHPVVSVRYRSSARPFIMSLGFWVS